MDFSRREVISVLRAMGIALPKETKLSDDALEKRLVQALDASQKISDLLPTTPVLPSAFPVWIPAERPQSLIDSVNRGNLKEASENALNKALTGSSVLPRSIAEEDTFREVRQILLGISSHWGKGRRDFVLIDKAQESAIVVRVTEVHALNDDCPVLAVLYKAVVKTTAMTIMAYLESLRLDAIVTISTTPLERKTMAKLLVINSRRLSSAHKPQRRPAEKTWRPSFILPLGPLNMIDIAKLTSNTGCEVCGKSTTSRCIQCLSAVYCGKECQRSDWQNHKADCRSLAGGAWHTISFLDPSTAGRPMYQLVLNKHDTMQDILARAQGIDKLSEPPPNIHGDKAFLVKIQTQLNPGADDIIGEAMLIYDRQRSFQAYWRKRDSDPELYSMAAKQVLTGWMGLKIYRWAKRVGDFQLSICFDRAPAKDPEW